MVCPLRAPCAVLSPVSLALERALELYTGIGLPLRGLLASGDYPLVRVEAAQMGLVGSFQES